MKQVMREYYDLIELLCRLLYIKPIEVYFFMEGDEFKLYYQYKIISRSIKDLPCKIKYVKYIPKEHVIYLNLKYIYELKMKVLLIREIRRVYQYIQIELSYFEKAFEDLEEIRKWEYSLQLNDSFKTDAPTTIDCDAFSIVVMRYLYQTEIHYHVLNKELLDMRVRELEFQYVNNLWKISKGYNTYCLY